MSEESNKVRRARTLSSEMSYVRCASFSESKNQNRRLSSHPSAAVLSRQPDLREWLSEQVQPQSFSSKFIHICCDTLAATRWLTKATTRARCKLTSVTKTSNTLYATLSYRRRDSRTFGDSGNIGNTRPENKECIYRYQKSFASNGLRKPAWATSFAGKSA